MYYYFRYETILSFILPTICAWRNAMINTTHFHCFQILEASRQKIKIKRMGKGEVATWGNPWVSKFLSESSETRWRGCWIFIRADDRTGTDGQCAAWKVLLDITRCLLLRLASHVHRESCLLYTGSLWSHGHCESCRTKRSLSLFWLPESSELNLAPSTTFLLLNSILVPTFQHLYSPLINSLFHNFMRYAFT